MKINHLKINGFGKFVNKEIDFSDRLNIVYGLNEAGKSTIQQFIPAMIFGLSKNKNGKEESDYDRYYPWRALDYSGKLAYTLKDGKKYEIFRDFNRKNPIVYDENNNDISSNFSIDKSKGILFFEEQTGIDKKLFLDTAVTEQKNVKLNQISQTNIIQKITNIISSGEENVSYNQVIQKLEKTQNEKIGTSRTTQKPINKINNDIIELEKKQVELNNYKSELDEILKDEKLKLNELEKENINLSLTKDMKEYLDSSKIQSAEIDFNKNLEEEYDKRILELKTKIDIKAKQNIRLQKKNFILNYILELIFLIVSIVLYLVFNKVLYIILSLAFVVANLVYIICEKARNEKNIKEKLKQIDDLQDKINKEIEILKESKKQKQFEIQIKNERYNVSILKNEEKLYEKYHGKIDDLFIEQVFGMEIEELQVLQNDILENINNINLELNTIKIRKEDLLGKLANVENLDSNLEILNQEKENLDSLNRAFNLAKECLAEAYLEMKEKVSPNLTFRLSRMVERISNGKYKNLVFDDDKGLCVELETGEFILCEKLSVGTIDEIYLSLRISVLEEISEEKLPIILDEAFAYFDDKRLHNIIDFLMEEYSEYQIIIFTCSKREIDILNKMQFAEYKLVEI